MAHGLMPRRHPHSQIVVEPETPPAHAHNKKTDRTTIYAASRPRESAGQLAIRQFAVARQTAGQPILPPGGHVSGRTGPQHLERRGGTVNTAEGRAGRNGPGIGILGRPSIVLVERVDRRQTLKTEAEWWSFTGKGGSGIGKGKWN